MTKRPGKKSIIASFGAFSPQEKADGDAVEPSDADKAVSPGESAHETRRSGRVGAGVIGVTQRTLTELREERDRLQALVDAGGSTDIEPALIDPSPFVDRLPDDTDVDFDRFKTLIAEEGQKVPIQVRPHPSEQGRYQVVYGHRRWRATRELGIKVKANILALDDDELVVAQGIENAARQDLSWIERAVFIGQMDGAGVRPRDIRAALSIDDAELARLRMVPRIVPEDIIHLIGRAPKIGRPRWLELARSLEARPSAAGDIRKTLSADKVSPLPSDERFRLALSATKAPAKKKAEAVELKDPFGKVVGKASIADGEVKLSVSKDLADPFRSFMETELQSLMERFFDRIDDD
ncbi:plasmid partitioning protein RepB [Fulvimarina sp. MAC8]|uniref:plasmid partitioning protein RepB n=1 Tax=Fulvimarina sp. MAC8 TaxID=3162874 RepID=UPI0032EE8687